MAAMPMLAGVGLMMMCCSSSSIAALMMGGEEKKDPVVPKTPAGPSAGPSADAEDVSTGAALPSTPPAVAEETLYTPPPPAHDGVTTVQLCSPWKAQDCPRAGAVMTCPEFKACYKSNSQVPCGGEAWYNKCGW